MSCIRFDFSRFIVRLFSWSILLIVLLSSVAYCASDAVIQAKPEENTTNGEEVPPDKIPQDVYPKEITPSVEVNQQTDSTKNDNTSTSVDIDTLTSQPTVKNVETPQVETVPVPVPKIDGNQLRVYQNTCSPRDLVEFFLDVAFKRNYDDALLTMDLSKLPHDTQDVQKYMLAYRLEQIIVRLKDFDPETIPDQLEKDRYYLWPDKDYEAIELAKQTDGSWKFSSATVANIDKNFTLIENKPPLYVQKGVLKFLPDKYFEMFLGLTYIQWFFLILYLLVGYGVYRISPYLAIYIILKPLQYAKSSEEYIELIKRALRPLAYILMVYIWYYGLKLVHAAPNILVWAAWIIHPFGIVLVMLSLLKLCDVFAQWLRKRMVQTSNRVGNVLVDLANRTLKCVIFFIGAIGIAQVYGFSAWGIISGMGIGGIAVALAAQQTIANFFGSLTIILDQPFTIGDWIVVDGMEGSVETIGLRSTRIRTFYNSLVIIPNNVLASSTIDNMGKRLYRRYKTFLTVQYDTPVELLEAFCGGVRALIESYSNTRKDDIRVCVNEMADSSINILLVCFFIAHSAEEENAARQRLILDILRLAKRLGVQFAFPSVTQYQIKQDNTDYPTLPEVKYNVDDPIHFGAKLGKQIAAQRKEDDNAVA